jgi:hypothetical protein
MKDVVRVKPLAGQRPATNLKRPADRVREGKKRATPIDARESDS